MGSVVKEPDVRSGPAKIVTVNSDGAWHEEIEIDMRDEDGGNFTGTVTMAEAKHGIYIRTHRLTKGYC